MCLVNYKLLQVKEFRKIIRSSTSHNEHLFYEHCLFCLFIGHLSDKRHMFVCLFKVTSGLLSLKYNSGAVVELDERRHEPRMN